MAEKLLPEKIALNVATDKIIHSKFKSEELSKNTPIVKGYYNSIENIPNGGNIDSKLKGQINDLTYQIREFKEDVNTDIENQIRKQYQGDLSEDNLNQIIKDAQNGVWNTEQKGVIKDFNDYYTLLDDTFSKSLGLKTNTQIANERSASYFKSEEGAKASVGYTPEGQEEAKKISADSPTIYDGDISTNNVDFFKLYQLKYFEGKDPFGGFIPIQLTSYKFDKIGNTDGTGWKVDDYAYKDMTAEGNDRIKIILPLKPGSITDTGSVSIKRKYEGNIAQKAMEGISEMTSKYLSKDFNNFLVSYLGMDYDYASLKKELRLPFILPLTSRTCIPTPQWCDNVRKALGILQGQLYPHTIYGILPNAFNLKLGNLYRGFKGFITGVDITFSEEQYTGSSNDKNGKNNGSVDIVWPLIIEGTITFKNLNSYMWGGVNSNSGLEELMSDSRFNLATQPGILFGDWKNSDRGGDTTGIGVSKELINVEKDSEEAKLYEGADTPKEKKVPNPQSAEEQRKKVEDSKDKADKSGGEKAETTTDTAKRNEEVLKSIDTDEYDKDYNRLDAEVEKETAKQTQSTASEAKTIASTNKQQSVTKSISNFFQKVNTTINTAKNIYNTVQNVRNGDYVNALSNLSSAFTTISPETSKSLNGLYNIARAGQNVINSTRGGVNFNNISTVFTNIETLTNAIENASTNMEFIQAVNGATGATADILNTASNGVEVLNKNAGNLTDGTIGKVASILGVGTQQLLALILGIGLTKKQTNTETK